MEQHISISAPSEIKLPTTGASFKIRFGARAVDTVLHTVVWLIVVIIVSGYAVASGMPISQISSKAGSTTVLILSRIGFIVFYHAITEYMCGASLGKYLFKIQVVNETGQAISMKAALIRSCAYLIDGLFYGLIAYESMRSSPLNQRHGDKWAKSVVIERNKLAHAQLPSGWKSLIGFITGITIDAIITALIILL